MRVLHSRENASGCGGFLSAPFESVVTKDRACGDRPENGPQARDSGRNFVGVPNANLQRKPTRWKPATGAMKHVPPKSKCLRVRLLLSRAGRGFLTAVGPILLCLPVWSVVCVDESCSDIRFSSPTTRTSEVVEYRLVLNPRNRNDLAKAREVGLSDAGVYRHTHRVLSEVFRPIAASGLSFSLRAGVAEGLADPASRSVDERAAPEADGTIDLFSGVLQLPIEDNTGKGRVYGMTASGAPEGASVTNVQFHTRILDEGDGQFFCGDYEIWLFSGAPGREFLVYNRQGAWTDRGFDDDLEDDADLEYNWRSTDFFDGEDPNQYWGIVCWDWRNGNDGELHSIDFRIHFVPPPPEPVIRISPTTLNFRTTAYPARSADGPRLTPVANAAFDLADTTADLGDIVPDEIVVRFRTAAASALHAARMVEAPPDSVAWLDNTAKANLPPLPREIVGLRPCVSGEAKALRILKGDRRLAAEAALAVQRQPLPTDSVGKVAAKLAVASEPFGPLDIFYARLTPGTDPRAICLQLMERDDVAYAHPAPLCRPDVIPNDPFYPRMWHLDRIHMPAAWDVSGNTLGTVRVCVVDTGVRITHSDLAGRIAAPKDICLDNGDAYADADPENDDPSGHGTACAGIIAALRDNGKLVAGIAPVTIIPVNGALWVDTGWQIANYWDGVMWGVDNGASVINLSLGTERTAPLQAEIDAANYAAAHGVLCCTSAGNDDASVDNHYPAAISSYICVGAVDHNDIRVRKRTWWWGSNYGDAVDVCAPGMGRVGESLVSISTLDRKSDNDYTTQFSGTSSAAPQVSGLAALLKHINGSLTAGDIRAMIEATAIDQIGDPLEDTPGWDPYHGHGLIDAAAAAAIAVDGNTQSFVIHNDGFVNLEVTRIATRTGASWIRWVRDPGPDAPLVVPPGEWRKVFVTIIPARMAAGVWTEQIQVYSNDPDQSPYPDAVYVNVSVKTAAGRWPLY